MLIRLGKVGIDQFRAVVISGTDHTMLPHLLQNFDNLKQLSTILKQLYNYCFLHARMAHVPSGGTTLLYDCPNKLKILQLYWIHSKNDPDVNSGTWFWYSVIGWIINICRAGICNSLNKNRTTVTVKCCLKIQSTY